MHVVILDLMLELFIITQSSPHNIEQVVALYLDSI